jgi:thiosulfate dehydrogenase
MRSPVFTPMPRAAPPLCRALLALAAGAWLVLLQGCAGDSQAGQGSDAAPGTEAGLRAQFPPDKHGELVYQGYQIFTQTPKAARVFAGNALSCSNCHLDAGRKADAAPLWAAWGMYPAYVQKVDRVITYAERVQQCFTFSINGLPPPLDSHEMNALLAYSQWLARGQPVGTQLPGRGFPTIARTGSDPNPLRGKSAYAQRCASCHGGHGEGRQAQASDAYAVPPLWGFSSFNKGAGLNRVELMAGFLKANMPLGNPDLTDQEALDIAAWIHLQERWPDPRKGLISGLLER